MTIRERMHNIGMAMFGPAESGPYGPPVAPPAPRPRNSSGRLLRGKKLVEFRRLASAARAAATDAIDNAWESIDSAFDGPRLSPR